MRIVEVNQVGCFLGIKSVAARMADGGTIVNTASYTGVTGIATVGQITEEARTTEDASGLVLAPGFVDPHTHYDAQLFWDPYATPSLNHGVTTVAAGNCGFTLAPLNPARPEDADYTRRMMSKVEGMSLVALEEGAPWSWHGFGDTWTPWRGGSRSTRASWWGTARCAGM
ncbi:hypothetical protein SALBM311S_12968 [Streptomyces alboniger]